jgi:hypothetical protein
MGMLAGIAMSVSGCGPLLLGYIVGDSLQRDKQVATCRANVQTVNQARIAKGQEPFPDQCS